MSCVGGRIGWVEVIVDWTGLGMGWCGVNVVYVRVGLG